MLNAMYLYNVNYKQRTVKKNQIFNRGIVIYDPLPLTK